MDRQSPSKGPWRVGDCTNAVCTAAIQERSWRQNSLRAAGVRMLVWPRSGWVAFRKHAEELEKENGGSTRVVGDDPGGGTTVR